MEAPKTEGNQPEDGGWIEVPKRSKKNKDAPVTQQHPQGQETSHPRGGGGKHGDNQGGARAPSRHPAGRELTPEEEEKKKAWTAEEEALKAKVVLTDEFDWSLGLALAKKSPEPAPATTGGPAPSSTWSKMLFPGGGKSQGPLVSSKTVSDKPLSLIGGVHISLVKHDTRKKNHFAVASLVVSSFPSLEVVYEVVKEVQLQEPFISGFYSFRDVGALVSLFNELKEAKPELVPQLLLVDGPGISYRGFGLATHLGVLLGLPTVGVTKKFFSIDGLTENQVRKLLAQELQKRGEAIEIIGHNSGNVLGAGMRTTDGPRGAHVYISVGHRISLPTAVEVVREASTGKLPQPIHQAQYLVKQELLKLDPKPKNLPISAAKGGNNRRPGNNNREGGNNNNSRREGGFRKDGGNKGQGGKIAGGLPNGKAGSPNQDDKKRPRGPRVQGEGGNRVQGRGPRQGHEQGQGQQGRQGLGKGKGGNKGGPQRGPGGQGNNSPQQGGAVQQGHGQPQGNNQQGGKRTGGPRGNNRSGGSPKQGNVWTQKVPAGGAPSTQPAAASQPQSSAPAAVAGDQQRPAGKQGGKPQGGDGQPKQGGSQKKQQQPPAGEKGEEKAQPVQAQSVEKKD